MNSSLKTGISGPTGDLYQQRRVAFHQAGKLVGRFSDQVYLFAIIWFLFTTTHSAIQVGIFLMCGIIPVAIISPFSGIIRERYQRQKLLAALNLFRCILLLILAGSLYDHSLSIWMLDAGTAILALGGAMYNPYENAIMSHIIHREPWTKAVVDQLWANSGALIGVLAGGFFTASWGFHSC